jgi:hypothetical protein
MILLKMFLVEFSADRPQFQPLIHTNEISKIGGIFGENSKIGIFTNQMEPCLKKNNSVLYSVVTNTQDKFWTYLLSQIAQNEF